MTAKNKKLELDVGNPRDHWVEQAHKLADQLRLPREFIGESRYIIEGAFTTHWLDRLFSKPYTRNTLPPRPSHDLRTLFGVAGQSQVVELIELAVYLKRMARCNNLNLVIDVLKNHYQTGLLQLAYAYRFQRAGCTQVELEPVTDRGKSDIYFLHDNRSYIAECYVPTIASKSNSVEKLQKCAEMIMQASSSCRERLRISVRLNKSITEKQGKTLGWWLSQQIRQLQAPYSLTSEHELASCEVRLIDPRDDNSDLTPAKDLHDLDSMADAIIDEYSIPKADLEKVRLGADARRDKHSRLLLWRPPNEREAITEEEYIEELLRRIGEKFRQAKRENDMPGRIVIAQLTWFAGDNARSHRIGRELQNRLVPRHENVAAILLVERGWSRKSRYKFSGLLIGGRSSTTIPPELFERINEQEQSQDILDDWR